MTSPSTPAAPRLELLGYALLVGFLLGAVSGQALGRFALAVGLAAFIGFSVVIAVLEVRDRLGWFPWP